MALRFGAFLSLHAPEAQFALARRVEELGFDSVWTGDHVSFHNPIYESLTLLAAYAGITRRIKLGSAVYLLALRHPTVAAKITGTLDTLSGGRLIFGVGVGGENPKEFEACGIPHHERGARVTEGIEVVRALWRDSPATFKGRFTAVRGREHRSQARAAPRAPHLDRGPVRRRAGARGAAGGWLGVLRRPARSLPAEPRQDPRGGRGGRSIPRRVRGRASHVHHGGA